MRWRSGETCMNKSVISIRDAVVSYREDVALAHCSLEIGAGEFCGIIGPNGAGKTTVLSLVNGLGNLVHGEVSVLGLKPFHGDGHRLRKRIGYVAQRDRIDPRLPISVEKTVATGAYGRLGWFRRVNRIERERVQASLEEVGIAHLAQRPIGHLSGGEYQRAAIARVLVQDPEIFLFDEPTAAIDPRAQHEILELIQAVHATRQKTCLYVTHELASLPQACQRLVLMKEGSIWREGPREAMLQAKLLEALYDGWTPAYALALLHGPSLRPPAPEEESVS